MVILANEKLSVTIAKAGAEIHSVMHQETGIEYIWKGDAKFWGRHTPVLFPIVGKLVDNQFLVNGETYTMTQHGFARDMEFVCVEQEPTRAVFCLTSNEQTLEKFPFGFELYITYILEGESVHVDWQVSNPDTDENLYFSIGAHPAFSTTLMPGDTFEDYYFELPEVVELQSRDLTADGQLGDTYTSLGRCREIPLHYDVFNKDALVFEDLEFESIALRCRNHEHGVNVQFHGFPDLGLWTPRTGGMEAPFICIEPWFGHADTADGPFEISQKPGIIELSPLKEFNTRYSMIFY